VILDGEGRTIRLGPDSNGITTPVPEGLSPLTATSTTYVIKNLTIRGGKSAIRLGATFNSRIEQIECIDQTEVAIECQFALMTRIQNVRITNPLGHGVWLGTGSFAGWGTNLNSQCNGSVLEQVRVYSRKGQVGNNFNIIHSNGVKMLDCISEGWDNDGWAVYYDGWNSTVKQFTIDNFHMEHGIQPHKGGIFVKGMANSPVTIRGLFAQAWSSPDIPLVWIENNTWTILEGIGWWTRFMTIGMSHHAPRLKTRDCHPALNQTSLRHVKKIFTSYIHFDS